MAKIYIFMIKYILLRYSFTNDNVADSPEFVKFPGSSMERNCGDAAIVGNEANTLYEMYLKMFQKTGTINSTMYIRLSYITRRLRFRG